MFASCKKLMWQAESPISCWQVSLFSHWHTTWDELQSSTEGLEWCFSVRGVHLVHTKQREIRVREYQNLKIEWDKVRGFLITETANISKLYRQVIYSFVVCTQLHVHKNFRCDNEILETKWVLISGNNDLLFFAKSFLFKKDDRHFAKCDHVEEVWMQFQSCF